MPKRILLADDSITIQKVVELTFSDGDYEIIATNNGARAIEKLAEVRPDIVLADIIMPEKNGYEVCEYIKSSAEYRDIPVILLTGTFEPFDPDRAERAGCDAVVTKPFESQGLIQKVDDLIAQAQGGGGAVLTMPQEPELEPEPEEEMLPVTAPSAIPFDAVTQEGAKLPPIPPELSAFAPPAEEPATFQWDIPSEPVEEVAETSGIFEAPPQPVLPPIEESPFDETDATRIDDLATQVFTQPVAEPEPIESSASADEIFAEPEEPLLAPEPPAPSYDFASETKAFVVPAFRDFGMPGEEAAFEETPMAEAAEPPAVDLEQETVTEVQEQAPAFFASEPAAIAETPFEEVIEMPAAEPLFEAPAAAPLFEESLESEEAPGPFTEMPAVESAWPEAETPVEELQPEPEMALPAVEEEAPVEEEAAWAPPAEAPFMSGEGAEVPEEAPAMPFEDMAAPLAPVELPEEVEEVTEVVEEEVGEEVVTSGIAVEREPEPETASIFAEEPAEVIEEPALALVPEPEPEPEPEPVASPLVVPAAVVQAAAAPMAISEDDVNRIARRVVEMLAADAIREIAWEVIPDLAEVIVRERIRQLENEG